MIVEIPKSKPMGRDEIKEFLLRCGWQACGNSGLQKQGAKRLFHIKFQEESLRIEVRSEGMTWLRIGGAFYRNVKLHTDGRMQIGTDFFKVD